MRLLPFSVVLIALSGCYNSTKIGPSRPLSRSEFVRDSINRAKPSTGAIFAKALADGLIAYGNSLATTSQPTLLTPSVSNELFKLDGTVRVSQDIYRSGNFYIETQYCYHFAYTELALYHKTKRKIIWRDDSTCDVKAIYKK